MLTFIKKNTNQIFNINIIKGFATQFQNNFGLTFWDDQHQN